MCYVLVECVARGKMRISFDPYSSFTPMLFINLEPESHYFIPFRHTMDVYVRDPNQNNLMWNFIDGLNEGERNLEEEFRNFRHIQPWELIINLDAAYNHGTQISCCARTIHGFRFEVSSEKNYRNISGGPFRSHLDFSTRIRQEETAGFHAQALDLIESMKVFNCKKTRDVDVHLKGTICSYKLDRFSYVHSKGVVPYEEPEVTST